MLIACFDHFVNQEDPNNVTFITFIVIPAKAGIQAGCSNFRLSPE
jgi:hypothetical protein